LKAFDRVRRTLSTSYQAGADLKTVQEQLGHSSILTTADTYTSVLPHTQRRSANATAKLVLTAARRTRTKIREKAGRNRPPTRPATGAPIPAGPTPPGTPAPMSAQIMGRQRSTSPSVTTPTSHPRDTHRPQKTETIRGLNRVSAVHTPDDQARPKGLEPPTF
jgi:hypothetical protein